MQQCWCNFIYFLILLRHPWVFSLLCFWSRRDWSLPLCLTFLFTYQLASRAIMFHSGRSLPVHIVLETAAKVDLTHFLAKILGSSGLYDRLHNRLGLSSRYSWCSRLILGGSGLHDRLAFHAIPRLRVREVVLACRNPPFSRTVSTIPKSVLAPRRSFRSWLVVILSFAIKQ